MTDIITSNGLGLLDGFRTGLSRPDGLGGNGTGLVVNATNRNLVVQSRDELLVGTGLDTTILRTYNSQGIYTDNNQDGFRFSFEDTLSRDNSDPALAIITRTSGDGHQSDYGFVGSNGNLHSYQTTSGDGAHDTIVYDSVANTYTWTEGSSQLSRVYEAGHASGIWRLSERTDANGNVVHFRYVSNTDRVDRIWSDDGRALSISYEVYNSTEYRVSSIADGVLSAANGTATFNVEASIVSYTYDSFDRLETVSHQLRPDDGNANTNEAFVTTYTYVTASSSDLRIASVTQANGVTGQNVVTNFTYSGSTSEILTISSEDQTTEFSRSGNDTTIKYLQAGGGSDDYVVTTDANGRVAQTTSPTNSRIGYQLVTDFVYDTDGNLIEQRDNNGQAQYYLYDGAGNVIRQWNTLNELVVYTYNSDNQLASETVYLAAQSDPGNTSVALIGNSRATSYLYDSNGINIRFVIDSDGAVTEHRYTNGSNTSGIADSTRTYVEDRYTGTIALIDLQAWVSGLESTWSAGTDPAPIQLIDRTFNTLGLLSGENTYTTISPDATGSGARSTQYFYESTTGALSHSIDANDVYTVHTRDALGRVISTRLDVDTTQGNNAEERVLFTAISNDSSQAGLSYTQNADGTRIYTVFNQAGQLLNQYQATGDVAVADTTNQLASTYYIYDSQGQLRAERVLGQVYTPTLYLYDELGRRVGEIDPEGALTEWVYNASGQIVDEVRYASQIDVARLAGFLTYQGTTLVGVDESLSLAQLFDVNQAGGAYATVNSNLDRHTRIIYDDAGRESFVVDAENYVVETRYNAAGQATDRIAYGIAYSGPYDLASLTTFAGTHSNNSLNRHTVFKYDTAGLLMSETDAEGYYIEYIYNGADQLVKTSRFNNKDGTAHIDDQHSYQIYDSSGQLVGSIDAESYLTTWAYRDNGQIARQTRYAIAIDNNYGIIDPSSLALADLKIGGLSLALSAAAHQTTIYTYNRLNEVAYELDQSGVFTQYTYDTAGRVASIHRGTVDSNNNQELDVSDDSTAQRLVVSNGYDALGRVDQAQSGLALQNNESESYQYDKMGRLISRTDTAGHATYYYYHADGRLRFTINALGEVVETRHNVFGEVVTTIDYATPTDTTGLTGGALTTALISQFTGSTSAKDRQTDTFFTQRGLVKGVRDPEYFDAPPGWLTVDNYHNAFGDAYVQNRANGQAPNNIDYRGSVSQYDRRGLVESLASTGFVGSTPITTINTSATYDAFGRAITQADGNNNQSSLAYDKLGRVLTVTDALNFQTHTSYDAFDRVLTQTDANNVVTTYTYDDINRTLITSITLGNGTVIQTTTAFNEHGEVAQIIDGEGHVTEYGYDANGNLISTRVFDRTSDAVPVSESAYLFDARNLQISSKDENGVVTVYAYDPLSRLTTVTADSGGNSVVSTTGYDHASRTVTTTNANGIDTATSFDRNGRVSRVVEDPNGLARLTRYQYDAEGLLTLEERGEVSIDIYGSPYDSITSVTQYNYDSFGRRVSEVIDPNGLNLATHYSYDNNDNVVKRTNANSDATYFVYNARNEQVFSIDPLGHLSEIRYDASGRATDQLTYREPVAGQLAAWLTANTHTPSMADVQVFLEQDAVVGVIKLGDINTAGLTQSLDLHAYSAAIAAGSLSLDITGNFLAPNHTAVRWMMEFLNVDGSTVGGIARGNIHAGSGSQESLGVESVTVPQGTHQVIVTYVGFLSASKGTVIQTDLSISFSDIQISAVDNNVPVALPTNSISQHTRNIYDDAGRGIAEVIDPDGLALTTGYSYDNNGNVIRRADANGNNTYFTYNARNQLALTVDALGFVSEIKYDALGQVIEQVTYRDSISAVLATWLSNNPAELAPGGSDVSGLLVELVRASGEYDRQLLVNADGNHGLDNYWSGPTAGVGIVAGEQALVTVVPDGGTVSGSLVQTIDLSGFDTAIINALGLQLTITGDYWAPSGTNARWIAQFKDINGADILGPQFSFMPAGTNSWGALFSKTLTVPVNAHSIEIAFSGFQLSGKFGATPVTQDTPVYFNNLQVVAHATGSTTDLPAEAVAAQTRYIYDNLGRQRFAIDSLGYVTENRYDSQGNIIHSIAYAVAPALDHDPSLVETTTAVALIADGNKDQSSYYVYDAASRLRFQIDNLGFVTEYRYDALSQLIGTQRYSSAVLPQVYVSVADVQAVLSYLTPPRMTHMIYDDAGRLIYTIDALNYVQGYVSEKIYDSADRVIKTIRHHEPISWLGVLTASHVAWALSTDSNNAKDQHFDTVRDSAGRIVYEVDGEGYVSEYRYDSLARIRSETRYATALDRTGLVANLQVTDIAVALDLIDTSDNQRVDYRYDAAGRIVEERRGGRITGFEFDSVGNEIGLIDGRGYNTAQTFDAVGRKLSASNALDETTATRYDATGNIIEVIDANGNSGYFQYDTAGRTRFQIDPNGYATEHRYDAFGNQVESIRYHGVVHFLGPVGTDYALTSFEVFGSHSEAIAASATFFVVTSVNDQHTTRGYDQVNQLIAVTDAESGLETFAYNAYGETERYTDQLGYDTGYIYDELGRLEEETRTIHQAVNGNLSEAVRTKRSYDAFGNMVQLIEAFGSTEARTTSYVYNQNNQLVQSILPNVDGLNVQSFSAINASIPLSLGDIGLHRGYLNGYFTQITIPANIYAEVEALGVGDWVVEYQALELEGIAGFEPVVVSYTPVFNGSPFVAYQGLYAIFDNYTYVHPHPPHKLYKKIGTELIQIADFSSLQRELLFYQGDTASAFYESESRSEKFELSGFDPATDVVQVAISHAGAASVFEAKTLSNINGRFLVDIDNLIDGVYSFIGSAYDTNGQLLHEFEGEVTLSSGQITDLTTNTVNSLQWAGVVSSNTQTFDAYGNVLSETDANQNTTYHYYDELNRRIATVDAERYLHEFVYDAVGNLLIERHFDNRIDAAFSLAGRPDITNIESGVPIGFREIHFTYDEANRVVEERIDNVYTFDAAATNDAGGYQSLRTINKYDSRGNLVHIIRPNGSERFAFYDGNSNLIGEVDGEGYVTQYVYDGNNNLTYQVAYAAALSQATRDSLSATDDIISLANEVISQAASVSESHREIFYRYDKLNRQIEQHVLGYNYSIVDAAGVPQIQSYGTAATIYNYDAVGNIISIINPDGGVVNKQYDGLGQLVTEQKPEFTNAMGSLVRRETVWDYDLHGNVVTEADLGHDDTSTNDDHITRYRYDAAGNLIESIDAEGWATRYYHDASGNVVVEENVRYYGTYVVSESEVSYAYDNVNQLVSTTDPFLEKSVNVYNGYGDIVSKGKFDSLGNGRDDFERFVYDNAGRVVKKYQLGGVDRAYLYDANGNVTAEIALTLDPGAPNFNTDPHSGSIYLGLLDGSLDSINETSRSATGSQHVDRKEYLYDGNDYRTGTLESAITVEELTAGDPTVTVPTDVLNDPFMGGRLAIGRDQGSFDTGIHYLNSENGWHRYYIDYEFDIPIDGLGDGEYLLKMDNGDEHTFVDSSFSVTTFGQYHGAVWGTFHFPAQLYKIVPGYGQHLIADFSSVRESVMANYDQAATYNFDLQIPSALRLTNVSVSGDTVDIQLSQAGQAPITVIASRLGASDYFVADHRDVNGVPQLLRGVIYDYSYDSGDGLVHGTLRLSDVGAAGEVFSSIMDVIQLDPQYAERRQTLKKVAYNAFGEISAQIDGRGYALANSNTRWALDERERLGYQGTVDQDNDGSLDGRLAENLTAAEKLALLDIYKTEIRYDVAGNVIEKIDPEAYVTLEDGSQIRHRASTAYFYDVSGRHIATQDANARLYGRADYTRNIYNADDFITHEVHADGGVRTFGYDKLGHRVSVTNELNVQTKYEFDKLGHVITVDLPYDDTFALAEVSLISNEYDIGPIVTQALLDNVERKEHYRYDREGRRIVTINARGGTEYTDYDSLGRLVRQESPGGSYVYYPSLPSGLEDQYVSEVITTHSYQFNPQTGGYTKTIAGGDNRSLVEETNYHGRVFAKTDLGGRRYTYEYDQAGRLVRQTSDRGALLNEEELQNSALSVDLDGDGYRDVGQSIAYSYYNNGLVKQVDDLTIGTTNYYEYDENGNRTLERYGSALGGVVYQNSIGEYDEINRLTRVSDSTADRGDYDIQYEFDANGNRVHLLAQYQDLSGSSASYDPSLQQEYWYSYDNMNRFLITKGALNGTRGSGTVVTGQEGYEIAYDQSSRRVSQLRRDVNDNIISREAYQYNVAGLLTHVFTHSTESNANTVYIAYKEKYDGNGNLVASREGWRTYSGWDTSLWQVASQSNLISIAHNNVYTLDNKILLDTGGNSTVEYFYDQRGDLSVTKTTGGQIADSYYSYDYWDSAKQIKIRKQGTVTGYTPAHVWQPGFSEFTYNANGHLTSVYDRAFTDGSGTGRRLSYDLDREGKITQRTEAVGSPITSTRSQNYYYFNDIGIGDVGDYGNSNTDYGTQLAQALVEKQHGGESYKVKAVTSADFEYNFQPINQGLLNSPGKYIVTAGDVVTNNIKATLSNIASKVWGDSALWYLLADANGYDVSSNDTLASGQSILLPNVVTNIHNNDSTFRPYDPVALQGNVQPTLPEAPPPKVKEAGCSAALIIILVIVVIVAAVVAAAAAAALTAAAVSAAGSAAAVSTATTVAIGVAAGTIGGTVGAVVGQLAGLAFGVQDSFDWKAVAISAAVGGIAGGFGAAAQAFDGVAKVAVQLAGAVTQNFARQGISIALGQQKSIDWTGVAVAGISGAVNLGVDAGAGALQEKVSGFGLLVNIGSSFVKSTAQQAVSISISGDGEIDWAQTAINAVGTGLANQVAYGSPRPVEFGSSDDSDVVDAPVVDSPARKEHQEQLVAKDKTFDEQAQGVEEMLVVAQPRSQIEQLFDGLGLVDREFQIASAAQNHGSQLQNKSDRIQQDIANRRESAITPRESFEDGVRRGDDIGRIGNATRERGGDDTAQHPDLGAREFAIFQRERGEQKHSEFLGFAEDSTVVRRARTTITKLGQFGVKTTETISTSSEGELVRTSRSVPVVSEQPANLLKSAPPIEGSAPTATSTSSRTILERVRPLASHPTLKSIGGKAGMVGDAIEGGLDLQGNISRYDFNTTEFYVAEALDVVQLYGSRFVSSGLGVVVGLGTTAATIETGPLAPAIGFTAGVGSAIAINKKFDITYDIYIKEPLVGFTTDVVDVTVDGLRLLSDSLVPSPGLATLRGRL